MEFVDRLLTCADCGGEFIFTAGEQLFFFDKQFKNDPKRCKPCKSKRSGAGAEGGHGACCGWAFAHGDAHRMFGVRHRDDGAVQADAGAAGALPAVLPEQARADDGCSCHCGGYCRDGCRHGRRARCGGRGAVGRGAGSAGLDSLWLERLPSQ